MDDLGAFDPMGLARSGMMYVAGNRDPVLIHIAILDQATAIAASHGILTALLVRERFGIGQEVHASLFGTGLWLSYANLLISNILSVNPTVGASRLEHSPLRNFFCCNDGKWIIGAHHPEAKYWPVFCEATGQKNLAVDCRFVSEEARADNCSELVSHFDKVFASKPREEWMEIFVSRGLMFCPIQHVTEIKDDPQAFANDYVIDFEDPILGKLRIPGYPIHFSKTRAATHSLGPSLGQHTELVLREVGYTDQEINDLKRAGVIR
jgi:crotonobetainyl-CoA:carnitine CoA-transferase CaiB-like acyl-CoA transferase